MTSYSNSNPYVPVYQGERAQVSEASCVLLPTFNMVVALFHLVQFFIVVCFMVPQRQLAHDWKIPHADSVSHVGEGRLQQPPRPV